MQVHTIGIDLAKNIFQVHGVDESHEVVLVPQSSAAANRLARQRLFSDR